MFVTKDVTISSLYITLEGLFQIMCDSADTATCSGMTTWSVTAPWHWINGFIICSFSHREATLCGWKLDPSHLAVKGPLVGHLEILSCCFLHRWMIGRVYRRRSWWPSVAENWVEDDFFFFKPKGLSRWLWHMHGRAQLDLLALIRSP